MDSFLLGTVAIRRDGSLGEHREGLQTLTLADAQVLVK